MPREVFRGGVIAESLALGWLSTGLNSDPSSKVLRERFVGSSAMVACDVTNVELANTLAKQIILINFPKKIPAACNEE